MIPNDPAMLLSFVNMKLRDMYASLAGMCDDLDISEEEIIQKLDTVGYHYDRDRNQFV